MSLCDALRLPGELVAVDDIVAPTLKAVAEHDLLGFATPTSWEVRLKTSEMRPGELSAWARMNGYAAWLQFTTELVKLLDGKMRFETSRRSLDNSESHAVVWEGPEVYV